MILFILSCKDGVTFFRIILKTAWFLYAEQIHVWLLSLHGSFTVTVKIMSIYLAALVIFSYLAWIKCIYYRHRRTMVTSLKRVLNISSGRESNGSDVRALIVTAHPDDECMFFAPTIIRLVELNARVHLLCLSKGMKATRFYLRKHS